MQNDNIKRKLKFEETSDNPAQELTAKKVNPI